MTQSKGIEPATCTCDIFSGDVTIRIPSAHSLGIQQAQVFVDGSRIALSPLQHPNGAEDVWSVRLSEPVNLSSEWLLFTKSVQAGASATPLVPLYLPHRRPLSDRFLLSICIPTYNRARRCLAAVESALNCSSPQIEVVVCDNGSPDNTLELLGQINDDRLAIFSNDENIGPIRNFNKALHLASGRYAMLHSDEDVFAEGGLLDLISYIEANPGLAAGLCSTLGAPQFKNTTIHAKGHDALVANGYARTYIGGFFFRHDTLDFKEEFKEYFNGSYLYPFENIAWKACLLGDFAEFSQTVVVRGKDDRSYFPRISGRHFNHPALLVRQYEYRVSRFRQIADGVLDGAELNKVFTNFESQILKQGFPFIYELPFPEKAEVLSEIHGKTPNIASSPVVLSLLLQMAAESLERHGDTQKAVDLFRASLEAKPDNVHAHFLLAQACLAMGDSEAANRAFSNAVSSTTRRWQFLLKTYNKLLSLDRFAEAKQVFQILHEAGLGTPDFVLADIAVSFERAEKRQVAATEKCDGND